MVSFCYYQDLLFESVTSPKAVPTSSATDSPTQLALCVDDIFTNHLDYATNIKVKFDGCKCTDSAVNCKPSIDSNVITVEAPALPESSTSCQITVQFNGNAIYPDDWCCATNFYRLGQVNSTAHRWPVPASLRTLSRLHLLQQCLSIRCCECRTLLHY